MNNKKSIDMINGPMFTKILLFALPLALSSVLQLLFNAADTIVVGRFAGKEALAAVGSNGALINLLVNLFMGLSIGSNVMVARFRGRGDEARINQAVHTSVFISLIGGVAMGIFGFIVAPKLLILMGTPSDVIQLSALYIRIYFIGMPFLMAYNFGAAILRAIGDTKRPLIYLTISGVVNVVLNLIFVIVLKMSVAGVALATVISQLISAYLVLRCLTQEQGSLRLDFKKLKLEKDILVDIVKIGLPAGLQGCVFSLSNVVIQSTINSFGSIVVAGNSAAANVEGFLYVGMNAFHQSAVTFSSQNYGAKKYNRCDRALLISASCAAFVGVFGGMLFLSFGKQLLGLYTSDAQVIEAGLVRMSILFKGEALNGLMDIMVGGLRGIGFSLLPTIVSLSGACVFRLVYIATFFQTHRTINMLYIVYPLSWALTTSVHVICYVVARRKMNQQN